MSYVEQLRKKIGHDEYIGVGAGIFIYKDRNVLLQKRKDNGCWSMHAGGLETGRIADEHRADEADSAPDTDRRERLHGIHTGPFEHAVGHGIREGDRRHVEGYAERIEREEDPERDLRTGREGVVARSSHEEGGRQVADAEQPLCRHPAVGHDSDDGGHEERDDALHGIEDSDMRRQIDAHKIGSHRGQVRTPDCILKKVHDHEAEFDSHNLLVLSSFTFSTPLPGAS